MVTAEALFSLLSDPSYVPAPTAEVARRLRLRGGAVKRLAELLAKEEAAGTVARIRGDRWVVPAAADLVTGVIQFRASGSAYVRPEVRPGAPAAAALEIQVAQEDTGVALHGDKVVVRLDQGRKVFRGQEVPTGRVIRLLERAHATLVGTLQRSRVSFHVVPDDPRFVHDILVPDPAGQALEPKASPGDKVVVQLAEWTQRHLNPEGEIVEVLGRTGDPHVELASVLRHHRLTREFPQAVEDEAARVPPVVDPKDARGREDFRGKLVVTIDPDDAKDFDDALSIERLGGGLRRVGIHIADVSHYVRPGSALDTEARRRGNSTYLVGTVVPMLPEALSNGLCSLVEGEDRLTQAVLITYDAEGREVGAEFARTVIRSRKRLTYRQALALMGDDPLDAVRRVAPPAAHRTGSPGRPLAEVADAELEEIRRDLRELWEIARVLRRERFAGGALDLDMPEARITVDAQGFAERIERIEHDESHQLVEEFMLAANEAVARRTRQDKRPSLYRVHDEPDADKLSDFRDVARAQGIAAGDLRKRAELVRALAQIRDHPQSTVLRIQLLRSLKKAVYRPTPDGHFGLNKTDYTHFTSPIRRYADLVVHRVIGGKGGAGKAAGAAKAEVAALAEHLSQTEVTSAEAERDHQKVKLMEYFGRELERQHRTRFAAVVTDVRNHGFFVEVEETLSSGMVHVSTLRDDFYEVAADGSALVGRKTRRRFAPGDRVMVEVEKVDRFKRQLDFRIADEAPRSGADHGARAERGRERGREPGGRARGGGEETRGRESEREKPARRGGGREEKPSKGKSGAAPRPAAGPRGAGGGAAGTERRGSFGGRGGRGGGAGGQGGRGGGRRRR